MLQKIILIAFIYPLIATTLMVQNKKSFPINDEERTSWHKLLSQSDDWYNTDEAIRIADNTLLFQRSWGGWPKNINMARHLTTDELQLVISEKSKKDATIDNGTTFPQLRYMAKIYKATGAKQYLESFLLGFDYLIEAQYENGGWPQFYPLKEGYYTHITFNDDAMIGVMEFMQDISQKQPDFSFVDDTRRDQANKAVAKGIEVLLKTQITVNGKLTAWCAQHDEITLKPANARSYELISISGKESIPIIEFLMKQENPSNEIKTAIVSACQWLESVKITRHRLKYIPDSTAAEGFNRVMINDVDGSDLWARFYTVETSKPLYVDRGGIICENYNDLSAERRNNYAYVEQFANQILKEEYPDWKKKNGIK